MGSRVTYDVMFSCSTDLFAFDSVVFQTAVVYSTAADGYVAYFVEWESQFSLRWNLFCPIGQVVMLVASVHAYKMLDSRSRCSDAWLRTSVYNCPTNIEPQYSFMHVQVLW